MHTRAREGSTPTYKVQQHMNFSTSRLENMFFQPHLSCHDRNPAVKSGHLSLQQSGVRVWFSIQPPEVPAVPKLGPHSGRLVPVQVLVVLS